MSDVAQAMKLVGKMLLEMEQVERRLAARDRANATGSITAREYAAKHEYAADVLRSVREGIEEMINAGGAP